MEWPKLTQLNAKSGIEFCIYIVKMFIQHYSIDKNQEICTNFKFER